MLASIPCRHASPHHFYTVHVVRPAGRWLHVTKCSCLFSEPPNISLEHSCFGSGLVLCSLNHISRPLSDAPQMDRSKPVLPLLLSPNMEFRVKIFRFSAFRIRGLPHRVVESLDTHGQYPDRAITMARYHPRHFR